LVKSKYLEAQVALLSSAMVSGNNRITLQNWLTAVKNSIDGFYLSAKPIAIYFFNRCRQGVVTVIRVLKIMRF
jgi:hypothetical protein